MPLQLGGAAISILAPQWLFKQILSCVPPLSQLAGMIQLHRDRRHARDPSVSGSEGVEDVKVLLERLEFAEVGGEYEQRAATPGALPMLPNEKA